MQAGYGGVPHLDRWNRRALDLFQRVHSPLYETQPHLGAAALEAVDIPIGSRCEQEALLAAWSRFYAHFTEFERKQHERDRNLGK